jgi:hypothetical protein
MVYLEHGMWEILDVLRRYHRGESKSSIEAATGRSRKTVARHVKGAIDSGWNVCEPPDENLASRVVLLLAPGPKKRTEPPVGNILLPHLEQIKGWLSSENAGGSLKLSRVQRLLEQKGVAVNYCLLHRFAKKHCEFGSMQITVRVADVGPGELAEIDFGLLGIVYDPVKGRNCKAQALIVTLVHSRHQYVHIIYSQTIQNVIEGLEEAWKFFGGVPARVVLDNFKAAVTKADRYDPILQRTFMEYSEYRGFIIDPAVPNHPKGKPHVERNVQYVRENFFRGQQWLNRDHLQREAINWCLQIAGLRKHGTTGKQPLRVFEDVEKSTLVPLSSECFDTPHWAECKVHPDHHVQFRKALYSLPTKYIGKEVTVRGDQKLVRIYCHGVLIKTHATQPSHGKSTDFNDYPKELAAYAMRDPIRLIKEAQSKGEHIGLFAQALLEGQFPWGKLRQAQWLLRLVNKFGAKRVDDACQRAIAFENINVSRLNRMLLLNLTLATETVSKEIVLQMPARFLRVASSFNAHQP